MGSRIYNGVFKIFFVTSFILTSMLMLMLSLILFVLLRPLNKNMYRIAMRYFMLTAYAHIAFITDWWSLLELNLYMKKDDFQKYFSKESALLIPNHSYDIDWLPLISMCARTYLLGNIRIFLKKSLQYIPIFGWSFLLTECVLLNRSYEKDEQIIKKAVRDFANYPYPIWLILYPEGTWFNQENHKKSQTYATKMNLPQLRYHLQPRTRGFTTAVRQMHGSIDAVYNIEIAFERGPTKPTCVNIINGKQLIVHIYIKRIAGADIPQGDGEQAEFLREMFQIKDRLRSSFIETGSFFTTSGVPPESCLKIERPLYIIPIFMGCCITVVTSVLYCVIYLYRMYGFIVISLILLVIGTCCFSIFSAAVKSTEIKTHSLS